MKNLQQKIKIGTELIYLDSKGCKQLTTVVNIRNKTFDCSHLSGFDGKFYETYQTFNLKSGIKSNYRYNYGNVIEVIGDFNN